MSTIKKLVESLGLKQRAAGSAGTVVGCYPITAEMLLEINQGVAGSYGKTILEGGLSVKVKSAQAKFVVLRVNPKSTRIGKGDNSTVWGAGSLTISLEDREVAQGSESDLKIAKALNDKHLDVSDDECLIVNSDGSISVVAKDTIK
jgi:hypothetical protein